MITYRKGDATLPIERGKIIIGHSVNTWGAWGAGFVIPLSQRYPQSKNSYLEWFNTGYHIHGKRRIPFRLGEFQSVKISDNLYIANIIAQSGTGFLDWLHPFRYESFAEACIKLNKYFINEKFTNFIIPRIGAGLGGADFVKVAKIIDKCISIPVTVYDIEPIENTLYI